MRASSSSRTEPMSVAPKAKARRSEVDSDSISIPIEVDQRLRARSRLGEASLAGRMNEVGSMIDQKEYQERVRALKVVPSLGEARSRLGEASLAGRMNEVGSETDQKEYQESVPVPRAWRRTSQEASLVGRMSEAGSETDQKEYQERVRTPRESRRPSPEVSLVLRLVLLGNPGKGKSALGNCLLKKAAFKAGITSGGGLTTQVAEAKNESQEYMVVDTPGVADVSADARRAALSEVTKTLRKGGPCKIIFIVTEQQSRIHEEDKATMKMILAAAPEIGENYGIVINQCSEGLMQMSRDVKWKSEFEKFLLTNLPYTTTRIVYCPFKKELDLKDDQVVPLDSDAIAFFRDLPIVTLSRKNIKNINADSFHKVAEQLKLSPEQIKKQDEFMQAMTKAAHEYMQAEAVSRRLGIQLKFALTDFPQVCNAKATEYFQDRTALEKLVEEIVGPSAPGGGKLGRHFAKHALHSCRKVRDLKLEAKILSHVEDGDIESIVTTSFDDMNFRDWAPIVAFGDKAMGKGLECPRDQELDCSIVDAVHSLGNSGKANFFFSWVWQYDLKMVLSALRRWQKLKGVDPETCFLWWCFFVNNQFRFLGEKGSLQSTTDLADIFGNQLMAVGNMLSMMGKISGALYPRRIWCAFELYVASQKNIPIDMLFPEDATEEFDAICRGGIKNIREATRIDIEKAEATSKDDEKAIKKLIQDTSSFKEVNETASRALATSLMRMIFNADDD